MVSFARDQLIRKENEGYCKVAILSFCESHRMIENYLRLTAVQSAIREKQKIVEKMCWFYASTGDIQKP